MCQHKLQLAPNGSGKGEHVVCVECNSKWARVLSRGNENPMPKAAKSNIITNKMVNELPTVIKQFVDSCKCPTRAHEETMADYLIRYMEWQRQ